MEVQQKQWRSQYTPKPRIGQKISSQSPEVPIVVVANTQPDGKGFIARLFRRASEDRWFASVVSTDKGLVAFINRQPLLGEKIKITEVHAKTVSAIVIDANE